MNKQTVWYRGMLKKYGTDEAISEIMAINARKGKGNKGGKFNAASEEAAQEARRKGGLQRAAKIRAEKQSQISGQDSDQES